MFRIITLNLVIILTVLLIILSFFIFWIWAMVDCLKSNLRTEEKLFWFIIIFFANFLGAILYLILSKNMGERIISAKNTKQKRLYKSKNKMLSGVCAGIAEYFNQDPTIIRLLWAVITLISGVVGGVLLYIIASIIIPERK